MVATAVLLLVVVAVALVEATVVLLAGAVGVGATACGWHSNFPSGTVLRTSVQYVSNIDMLDAILWLVDHVISVSFAVYMCRAH